MVLCAHHSSGALRGQRGALAPNQSALRAEEGDGREQFARERR